MLSFNLLDGKLEILFNNSLVYQVSKNSNIIDVGTGIDDYSMSRGSFKIKERGYKKEPLSVVDLSLNGNKAVVDLNKGSLELEIINDHILITPKELDSFNRLWFKYESTKNEHFYGGGENFAAFDLKGKKHNVWVAEHINVGQTVRKIINIALGNKNNTHKQKYSNYETYYAQPTFISSKKYFFHSTSSARTVFDFKKDDISVIRINEVKPFIFGFGKDFENLLKELTSIIGRQIELPEWCFDGQILGIQGGTDIMMDKYKKVKEANGKVSGIWIQDWEGRRVTALGKQLFWNWEWDKDLYPNLDKKIKELNKEGVKVLGYCNPFLAIEKDLYKEAAKKGYCVKDKDGNDYLVKITTFPAAMVDLTNEDAYNWLKEIIKKNLIDFGFSGWMADFAEYLPTDCVLYSKEDPEIIHNSWPERWAKLNREALIETNNEGKIMFFTRSGFTGSVKYSTMMWNGDNHPDFSIDFGLPSCIPAMLSLSCIGMGLSHSDIGGYTTIKNLKRNQEVYYRWFEMNAWSPLMRGHEGLNPDLNVQFTDNKEILDHCSKMGRIHEKLKPYLMDTCKYNSLNGVGMVRPLFFYYDEERAYTESFEYLLGRDILVCPVLKEGAREMNVYLPEDEWVHIYTGDIYKGGSYKINSDIGKTPVFYRKNSSKELVNIINEIVKENY